MTVAIKEIRPATNEEWDDAWSSCEYGTYFQSREWAEIWQSYGETVPDPYFVSFSDDRWGIFPLSRRDKRHYVSSPAGTYGGLISIYPLGTQHFAAVMDHVIKSGWGILIRTNPFGSEINARASFPAFNDDETHAIDLRKGMSDVFKTWTKGHKSAVTKARREGVTVNIATSWENWQDYYSMYQSSLERWGMNASSRYELKLFQELFSRSSSNIKLWLAWYEGRAIAGALCLYAKRHVVYWHGAALQDYFNLRPVQLLLYEAIVDAVNQDNVWFDFNPSGGHDGVRSFKAGFGTKMLSCPWINITVQTKLEKLFGVVAHLKRLTLANNDCQNSR